MITPKPSAAAFFASCSAAAGVRCAEQIRTSAGMANDFSRSTHFSITFRSLSDPMTTSTFFIAYSSSKTNEDTDRPVSYIRAQLAAPMPESMHECPVPRLKNCMRIDCAALSRNTLPIMCTPLSLLVLLSVEIHQYFIQSACVLQAFYAVFSRFVQMPKDGGRGSQLSCRTPFPYSTASIWRTRSLQEHCAP